MLINAPFTIGVVDNQETGARELQFNFTDEFRAKSVEQRAEAFGQYVRSLQEDYNKLEDDNPDKMGMMTVHQISNELLPHIIADEIPLFEVILVDIGRDAIMVNLLDGVTIQ